MLDNVSTQHLEAAESEGRALSDHEAALIETTTAADIPQMPVTAAYIPSRSSSEVDTKAETLTKILAAVQERQPFITAAAADYATSRSVGVATPASNRLVEFLKARDATNLGEQARTFQVPKIASGEAAKWTPGQAKAEIVTELGSVASEVIAAYTSITSTGFMDIPNLDVVVNGLLSREVVRQENAHIATSLAPQAFAPLDSLDYQTTVGDAVTEAMLGGAQSLVLILGANVGAAVLGSAFVGSFGRDSDYTRTLMGHPFVLVDGLDVDSCVAVDPRAVAVAASPLMTLVDPSSRSTTNSVIVRQESSVAVVAADPRGVGVAKKIAG